MGWNRRAVVAAMVSMAFVLAALGATFVASVLQVDPCRACGARLDVVLFGATIAGPTLPVWPLVAAAILYVIAFPGRWRRLAWTALPVGLMVLGDSLHHLLSFRAGWLVTVPQGLALTWVGSGGVHLSSGGNLLATAGLVGGIGWLAKKTVFDALVATRGDPSADHPG